MKAERHKYEYKVTPNAAAVKVVRMVGPGKRVLEIGPGPGAITQLLKDNQCHVTALELDEKAIEIVSKYCEVVHQCDLNDSQWPATLAGSDKFTVAVAGDVLEHLYDPWTTLANLRDFLTEDGYVVISLPHVGHNAIVACLLTGNFEYQPWGLLDKTHIRFFCMKNIQKMFVDAGFKIVEADFVVRNPEQTEFAANWRQLSAESRQALSSNKFGMVYQVVIRAVPDSAPGKSVQLASLLVAPPAPSSLKSRIRAYLISFLSLDTRRRIGRMLERLGLRS